MVQQKNPNSQPRFLIALDPHLRRALTLWGILAVAVCVKTVWLGGDRLVYPVFAASSHHWWSDKPLYVPYGPTEGIDGFRYSPAFAVAFTPLAYLPGMIGAIAWNLLSIGLLLWALHVLVRDVLPGAWPPWREGVFLTLTLGGSAVGIWSGHSNAIVPALIILALAAIVRQRWWWTSTLLAAAVFIKLWPMAIVLLLIACWPRQLSWRFAVVCVVLALLPFLTRPPDTVAWQYHEWYLCLKGPLQARGDGYRDAWTIWEQCVRPVNHHAYMALQLVAALGVFGWCLWQRRRALSTGQLLIAILSIWASCQLLFWPVTEQLTYGIIAPSAGWAVLVSFAERKARWLTVTAWAILALLPSGDVEKAVLAIVPHGMILLPLGVVLFVAWLLWHEQGRASAAVALLEEKFERKG